MYEVVKVGFYPIGKFVFSHEDAKVYKAELEKKFNEIQVNYIGIDKVIRDGIIRSYDDVEPAVEYLNEEILLDVPHRQWVFTIPC